MSYIHGFDQAEQQRLVAQAIFLEDSIFEKINFSGRKKILEVGCGVGSQTDILLNRYPNSHVTGVDISSDQLDKAKIYLQSKHSSSHFSLQQMDAMAMSFPENTFDAIHICWVLEHVSNPQQIVDECYRVLSKGGIIFITEVNNNNLYFIPQSSILDSYWNKFNALQIQMGGNPFVGVQIGNYAFSAGFENISTIVQSFLLDNNQVKKREQMINYWTDLMLSGFDSLLENNKVTYSEKNIIIKEMNKVKTNNGVFHYAFIQASGIK